ncbi:MAG: ATP-dependent helicase UvrD/PcrA [Actinomycetota bacterium]|nr:ATP-dependent helicase UvrD/PcrA [Actinomycetota bacterium]
MRTAPQVLAGLDPDQQQAAATVHGPVAIIAGAGSGKTRVITHRIAYGVLTGAHDPARSVAVTFTTKASGEMTRRLRDLGVPGVRVRTFHAAALRQLRHYYPRAVGRDLPEVTPVKAPLIGASASSLSLPTNSAALRDYSAEVEWAKVNSIPTHEYAAAAQRVGRVPPASLPLASMASLYAEYERRKTAAGRIDFEDVLLLMVGLLNAHPQVAAHVRSGLHHITVDEYQDASPLQQRLLDGWLGDNDNLCVVGDPSQTIYSFAGADATLLTGFAARYPGATVVTLPRTYRCSPEIAAAANKVLAQGREGVTLVSQRESGPAVRVRDYPDAEAEAQAVAARIEALIDDGIAAHEMAILVRMNAMTEPFEEALANRGIGYQISGGTGFFHRAEVRKAIAVIRGAAVAGGEGGAVPEAVSALLSGLGWSAQPPVGSGASRDRWESLAALHAAAVQFAAGKPDGTLADFGDELRDRAERQDAPDGAGVTLASLHSAKGAEWQVVFLVGLTEGVLPHSSATTDAEVAEERRLFYVGITRAARVLELSYGRAKTSGGRVRRPSRFLEALSSAVGGAGQAARGGASARKPRQPKMATCRTCGATLATGAERSLGRCRTCPGEVDLELLERLREWRTATAAGLTAEKGTRVPAFVVATDATLQAIAEQHPTDIAALAEIPGIGPRKVDDYGEALLAVVRPGP